MEKWLKEKLFLLNPQATKTLSGGYTRLAFSKEELLALEAFVQIAKELNLEIERDEIGNIIATYLGKKPELPSITFGSHVDTVVNGGAFDGVAGVVAGLAVIHLLKLKAYQPLHTVKVICFIAEESARFGVSTIGSKAFTSLLNIDELKEIKDKDNITIEQAIRKTGANLSKVSQMNWKKRNIHSYVELHIEQGPILKDNNFEIGIVEGIANPLRYSIKIHGEASHTGTTPMGKRKDALSLAAQIILFIENLGVELSKHDHFVATSSTIKNKPNAMNVIPAYVELGIDIRSINSKLLYEAKKRVTNFCDYLVDTTEIKINLSELVHDDPVFMDPLVLERLKQATRRANKTSLKMISGAGHDAMNMAKRWPSGMIFIPCNGISHHPKEFAEMKDITDGVDVLMKYIKIVDESLYN